MTLAFSSCAHGACGGVRRRKVNEHYSGSYLYSRCYGSKPTRKSNDKRHGTKKLRQLLLLLLLGHLHWLMKISTFPRTTEEVLDHLLDQEGLEVDPVDRLERDTPLHKAVRFINGLSKEEWEDKASLVELLIDAGADPKIRNKAKLKPFELVDPRNKELRVVLQKAEFSQMAGDDVVDTKAEEEEGPTGSASDSE